MDFTEAMDICAYDVARAAEMYPREVIEGVLLEVGLEKLQPESDVTDGWRLRCEGCCDCSQR